jgi:hypothetical protein
LEYKWFAYRSSLETTVLRRFTEYCVPPILVDNMTAEARAWQFVNQILEECAKVQARTVAVPMQPFPKHVLYSTTLKLLKMQDTLLASNVNGTVTIGYHYTSTESLNHIQTKGFLTKVERQQHDIKLGKSNGSAYGDGIYTANNPFAFCDYGAVCVICVRLPGRVKRVAEGAPKSDPAIHTFTGTKLPSFVTSGHFGREVVLQFSSQIIPVLHFEHRFVITAREKPAKTLRTDARWRDVQTGAIMDEYITTLINIINSTLNCSQFGRRNKLCLILRCLLPSAKKPRHTRRPVVDHTPVQVPTDDDSAPTPSTCQTIQYDAPPLHSNCTCNLQSTIKTFSAHPSECTHCIVCRSLFYPLEQRATVIDCGHTFHQHCIQKSMLNSTKCPICCRFVQGTMPLSGTMSVTVHHTSRFGPKDGLQMNGLPIQNTLWRCNKDLGISSALDCP